MAEFAHLHLHTEYSLLDGMGRIEEYVARAKETGIHHMAVTDHGVMYAAMDWYQVATKHGLHPIIGMEAYLAEGPIAKRQRKSYHLLLLAENETGYRNLLKLASIAALEGFYYRPRIDMDLLQQHHEGIIATSACLGGPVSNPLLHGEQDKAEMYAGQLAEIFGKDRFFIEIQDHGIDEQLQVNKQLLPLAKKFDLPLVATNDVHYCGEHDAAAQDVLVCVQTNTTIQDPKRLKTESSQLYLKSPMEMEQVFSEIPEALSNTIRIAEMCSLDLGFKGYQMPDFDVPDGGNSEQYLRHLCEQGAMKKYGTLEDPIGERLDYELSVIGSMGFTNYFLIVWDFVRFAHEQNILVGPGRGSAAGSLVTYTLDITGLDPLKYDLLFERFLNPARISMPDIDIDFADDRRDEVIAYVVNKYGDDRVAQIVTFGTLKAKAAVRDVGRAMGLTVGDTNKVARLIPTDPKMTIDLALEQVPELSKLYEAETQVKDLIETARKVEGLARHSSTHAAGVVISRDKLVDHVPLQRAGGKSEGDITTQYPMDQLEGLGLLKMDFLGLKTLSVLGKAVALAQDGGHDISLESIPMEDPKTFELLKRGETVGVFQLEGGMTTRMTIDVAPTSFEDLIALMALIRPGPMEMAPDFINRKLGKVPIEYSHPDLADILEETYGIALYQEQVMQIANVLAGFSMAEADGLRKAMGKKLPEEMAKYRDRFVEGATEKGTSAPLAGEIFDMVERFAGYGFNKSHSAAYAVIAAQTAYMKANFPVEFMAALMTTEIGSTEKTVFNVAECRRSRIPVLPPDVNASGVEFSVEPDGDGQQAIRFGLTSIRGVGRGAVEHIVAQREATESGRFASLADFCDGVEWSIMTKRAAEALVKAGAFDTLGERASVLASLENAVGSAQHRQKAAARGQMDMFGMMPDAGPQQSTSQLVSADPADSKTMLAWEKEFLGLYLSSHPLVDLYGMGTPEGIVRVTDISNRHVGERISMVGMITGVRRITTRTNRTMAVLEVEDLTGSIEIVIFPDAYEQHSEKLEEDMILKYVAKVDERNETRQLIADDVSEELPKAPEPVKQSPAVEITLSMSGDVWDDIQRLQDLDAVLQRYEGPQDVFVLIAQESGLTRMRSRNRRVEWTSDLAADLEALLGAGAVMVEQLDEVKISAVA